MNRLKLDIQRFAEENGKIIIGTEIDDSDFYKKIKEFENTKIREIEIDPEIDTKNLEKEIVKAISEVSKYKDAEIISEEEMIKLNELVQFIEKGNELLEERTGKKFIIPGLNDAKEDVKDIEESANRINLSKVEKEIGNVGKSIQKVTKKIGKMALAVFGIRSAFMFVRNAINTIAGDDEQLKADIDYMKSAIAYTLEPVVRGIVNLVKQLMFYVGYIVKAWTGINIFENANKGLKNANKQAKELKKTTASFDEMNVLSDSSSKEGTVAPSFDLTKPEDYPIPGWIEWIADNGDIVIKIIKGIGLALVSLKLASFLQMLGLFSNLPLWQVVTGIALVIAGIVMLVKDIIDFISNPSWEGFINILGDVAIIIGGIMILMGNWWGLLVVIIGAIVKLVANNWDAICDILGSVGNWINDKVIQPVAKFFDWLWNNIKTGFKAVWEFIMKAFTVGGKIFNGIKEGIVAVFKTIINALISGINTIIALPFKGINKILNFIRNISFLGIAPFKGLWEQNPLPVPQIPKLARGGIVNNPGPGVMMGNYIAGERGAEAVLPLTDDTLQKLANMIPITVNVTNTMNGRVISRELQKVQNARDFAYNR